MTGKLIIGVVGGALVGLAVGFIGQYAGGSCPLTCNPFGGMIVGAIVGSVLGTG